MTREESKEQQVVAQQAADWLLAKLELRVGGYGKEAEHTGSERAALQVVHSLAVCEVARLQAALTR